MTRRQPGSVKWLLHYDYAESDWTFQNEFADHRRLLERMDAVLEQAGGADHYFTVIVRG